jgi:hypothetical protein
MSDRSSKGRTFFEFESPEELFRIAAAADWPAVLLNARKRMLFAMVGFGYVYYAKITDDSPWMSARFAIVNELKGYVRPSDAPSTEADEASIAIVRVSRVFSAKRREGLKTEKVKPMRPVRT